MKNGIAADAAGKPKKADKLNADLAGQSVYSKPRPKVDYGVA